MEFDGNILFVNSGSGYPRTNDSSGIPSSMYVSGINDAFQLGALDFFERGETLEWNVTPMHENNPSAGNVFGFGTVNANNIFPFSDAQYDVQEGVLDPDIADVSTDPVSRNPAGFLILGFHGFKIIQPPGPVRMV
jgi:hypothetical protein